MLLFVFCGTSWAATTDYDPFRLHSWYVSSSDEAAVYRTYGNSTANFFYQLRDVAGATRSELVGGPQWFATVYENYRYRFFANTGTTTNVSSDIYRRTMGGEIPDIPFSTVGDIIDGFNFVFAEEPQPYSAWTGLINSRVYDVYPDPLETLCIVTTNGMATVNVRLGNPYARHFPFWWNFTRSVTSGTWSWWRNNYDWRNSSYATVEPIEYIYSPSDRGIYTSGSSGLYERTYNLVSSNDLSGDVVLRTHHYIKDLSGNTLLTVSGDISGDVHYYLNASGDIAYTVSGDSIYDSSNSLKYAIVTDGTDTFICGIRNIGESITMTGLDGYYNVNISPAAEQSVSSGNYLDATVRLNSSGSQVYGSRLGWLAFRQRASFLPGYTNYRESSPVPVVVANVSNGGASDNPLIFDMTIYEQKSERIINRVKFTWDVQADKTQDIGTFFMIQSPDATMPTYDLETRITNRTGTRYKLYRYDMDGSIPTNGNPDYRDNYRNILPDYWKYDLTPDEYGTLPEYFLLGAQSQIAPGLVTVYGAPGRTNASSGYTTLNTTSDTSASFRLYDYAMNTPRNLRLSYRRIRGMESIGQPMSVSSSDSGVNVQRFSLEFVDVVSNDENTRQELTRIMGKPPVMATPESFASSNFTGASQELEASYVRGINLGSSAIGAFQIADYVPADLVNVVVTSEDTASDDNTTPSPSPDSDDTSSSSAMFTASSQRVSQDIPLLPVYVRMTIPRNIGLIVDHWEELDNAGSSQELLTILARYATVWVRSAATAEMDTNLFTAINNKGSEKGVTFTDCVRAFLYDDKLYIDFIAVMADGKSTTSGKTAYIDIFKDDNVPYVLIGDGSENGIWDLSFCVDSVTRTSSGGTTTDPTPTQNNTEGGGGGGGGCASVSGLACALILLGMAGHSRKK